MANFSSYPLKDFNLSQNFLAAESGDVVRVNAQEVLDAAVEELLTKGEVVKSSDTKVALLNTDYISGTYVIVGGDAVFKDGGQAIYRVSDPGSGGDPMSNGNEAVLVYSFNFGTSAYADLGTDPSDVPTNGDLYVDSVADLPAATGSGRKIYVKGYYDDGQFVGGGQFVDTPTKRHNGVLNFDPSRSAQIGTAAYYVDSGIDVACWVRTNHTRLTVEMAGAKGAPNNDVSPFQAAIDVSNEVFCTRPLYKLSSIQTSQSVAILGLGNRDVAIETVGGIDYPMIFSRSSDIELTLKNLRLIGSGLNGVNTGTPHYKGAGVWCSAGKLHIENCEISNWSAHSIWTGNISDNWDINVYVDKLVIKNCTIDQKDLATGLGDCMRIERTNNVEISNNICDGGASGIRTQLFCNNMDIYANEVSNSYSDVGITIAHCTNARVYDNVCFGHDSHGIEADSCYRSEVHDNICYNNGGRGILFAEYTTPADSWYAGYIDGVLIPAGTTLHPVDSSVHDNQVFDNEMEGIQCISPENCFIRENNLYRNCLVSGNSNIQIATNAVSGNVQDVKVVSNTLEQSSSCLYGVSISSYQLSSNNPVVMYDNMKIGGQLCNFGVINQNGKIVFEKPIEAATTSLVSTEALSVDVPHGFYFTLTDPADPGQIGLTWNVSAPSAARSYLFRGIHRGNSDTVRIQAMEYYINSAGTETFRRTILNATISQSATFGVFASLVTSTSNNDYNTIKFLYISDDDTGATVDISDAQVYSNT